MKTMTLVTMSLLLAAACGGKSKAKTADPVPVTGEGETGGNYGGGGNQAAKECVTGIPECDEAFKHMIACVSASPDLADEEKRTAALDTLFEQCDQLTKAAADEAQRGEATKACVEITEQGPQIAEQLHCTW